MATKVLALLGTAVWAACAAGAAVPLPEHPRPDWERAAWVNLNGEWDFGFEAGKYDRKILVPFGWGSPLSGVGDGGDTGFYRREVVVPAAWKGKRVFVVVGAADHDTACTFDGNALGGHSGGYVPFEFELTEFVKWGEGQTLEFRVWDPPAEVAQEGHYLYGKQGYGNARGIWQTVYLEARGEEYLEGVRFYPNLKLGTVTAVASLALPAKTNSKAVIELDGKKHEVGFKAGEMSGAVTIKLEKPRLWTLDDPYLYDATLTLIPDPRSPVPADVVRTYFGFREIGVGRNPNGDSYVTLNGKPVYLQLCLDQSYHPEGWYTFPTDEFMRNEILLSKKLGLTGNRVHIKVELPRKLYWADRLGVLIQADVPCAWGDASEAMFEEHWKCFEGMVRRDFNHPSVYQWTLFNETWGLFSNRSLEMGLGAGNGGRKRVYRDSTRRAVASAYRKAKALDPTRLVEDNSPCNEDHVVTDVNSWHGYRPGWDWERTVRQVCADTYAGSRVNYVGGRVQGGEPMMNSECGNVWGYTGSTGDCDFTWDYHLMMNAFRRHLKCAGWLYTEHHDVCNEWNGYVRFDRSPKFDGLDELAGMTLADFHGDAALFFAGTPGWETGEMLSPGQEVAIPVGVSLTTDRYAGQTLELRVDGEGGAPAKVAKSWQCETLWTHAFVAPSGPACGVVRFALLADGREIARNFWSFGVTNALPKTVVADRAEWSGGTTNVLGGLKLNGFGKGFFEFVLAAPEQGGVFRAELSAKRRNGKDLPAAGESGGLDYMLGGGDFDRSRNPNSYPQTSGERFPSNLRVLVNGRLVKEMTLPDDPADHRGILSWLSQPRDGRLREAGSYGWLVEAPVSAEAAKGGKVTVRLEADNGLAVYGPAFGRHPIGPGLSAAPDARAEGCPEPIFLECEQFGDLGGWSVDSQFIDEMGSSYLLAHGLGRPVADATTTFEAGTAGRYSVFVRTKNWTAKWSPEPGAGRFRVAVNGVTLPNLLGVQGRGDWLWSLAGAVTLKKGKNTLALRDVSGFDGRCDAVCLTADGQPPRRPIASPATESVESDLTVVGGGIAGICTAISAARLGLKVALVQDRPVLGGANSSEVRVHLGGYQNLGPYPRLGDVVAEIGPKAGGNAQPAERYEDDRKLAAVKAEKNIRLFLNTRVVEVEPAPRGEAPRVRCVVGRDVVTGARTRFASPLFADCTGDGCVGYLAGADWRLGRESKAETGETMAPETGDRMTMGASCQWYAERRDQGSGIRDQGEGIRDQGSGIREKGGCGFPNEGWMIKLNEEAVDYKLRGDWDWETGMNRDQLGDFETVRDYAMLVAYSNWNHVKNVGPRKAEFADAELVWLAYVAGKRETRRLMGDLVLTQQDVFEERPYPDGTCCTTWAIDLHYPMPANQRNYDGEPFRSICTQGVHYPYPIPYRCLYSRNVPNLFMAGRDISVTHVALGTTRVMRTHGMMGEVVGMAASICRKHGCDPRGVYTDHLDELKALMTKGVGLGRPQPPQNYNCGGCKFRNPK